MHTADETIFPILLFPAYLLHILSALQLSFHGFCRSGINTDKILPVMQQNVKGGDTKSTVCKKRSAAVKPRISSIFTVQSQPITTSTTWVFPSP